MKDKIHLGFLIKKYIELLLFMSQLDYIKQQYIDETKFHPSTTIGFKAGFEIHPPIEVMDCQWQVERIKKLDRYILKTVFREDVCTIVVNNDGAYLLYEGEVIAQTTSEATKIITE